jgi:GntR family transcriptional regulator
VSIDPNSPVPVYLQIADHIRGAVAAGVYRPGEAIPSVRVLALDLTVNPNTVQRAFEELEREGLIEVRKGLGMFVAKNGVNAAVTQSEQAMQGAFVQAIRGGRAARIPSKRIRAAFDAAWRNIE